MGALRPVALKYLVTGGLGFLGAPLVRALTNEGNQVRVLDNGSRGSSERLAGVLEDVEIIEGDVRDPDIVYQAIQGVDRVCHLAFVNGTRNFYEKPAHVLDVGVKGIVNLLDGCIRADVGELAIVSSSEVYQAAPDVPTDESVRLVVPDPHNPRYSYAGGKIITELMALQYGREYFERVLVVRPHNVYGPNMGWDHVIPEFVSRLMPLNGDDSGTEIPFTIQGTGEQSRAFIYIEDFVDGMMLVLRRGEHLNIYNIGTMEEILIKDVAHNVAKCLGKRIQVVPGPEALGGTMRRCPDIGKLQRLGFEPRYRFDEGLPPTVEWYAHQ